MNGKYNIAIGFLTMGFSWLMVFYSYIYVTLLQVKNNGSTLKAWENIFETRLAHVHGNLFAFLNILIGYLLLRFKDQHKNVKTISWLALIGLLMPLGILSEVYFGLPPVLVLIGAISISVSVVWLGFAFLKMKPLT